MLVFEEGRKPENPAKNPWSKLEPTTNLTHMWHQAGNIKPGPHC